MFVDIYNTDKKYNIIYADPPWHYKVWSKKGQGRSAESHYKTMEQQSLDNLGGGNSEHLREKLHPIHVGYVPLLTTRLRLIKKMGLRLQNMWFLLDQNKQTKRYSILGYGLLD